MNDCAHRLSHAYTPGIRVIDAIGYFSGIQSYVPDSRRQRLSASRMWAGLVHLSQPIAPMPRG